MLGSYEREQIENWAGDFVLSDRSATLSPQQRDAAPQVLIQFLIGACEARGVLPHEIEESDVRAGLLGTVAGLKLPAVVAPVVPEIVAGFLTMLEEEGRLSDGRRLAAFARALGPGFAAAASPKSKPIVNPGSPLGRNDPCPCGSGRKFKKCCMRG